MRLIEYAGYGDLLAVTLAGVELAGTAIGPTTIKRGRRSADVRPDASMLTTAFVVDQLDALPEVGQPITVDLGPDLLAALSLSTPAAATRRFTGMVTDAKLRPSAGVVVVTAAGPRSRAARIPIGDAPWPAELDGDRAERILTALAAADDAITVGLLDPGTVTVIARDVDRQPAAALLDQLAADTGGDCWETRAGTLEWRDARNRQDAVPAIELAARNVLVDPEFEKNLDGLVTDLTVGYGAPAFDPVDGSTSQPTVQLVDSGAAIPTLAARVSTQLASASDATAYAIDVVGRRSRPRWRVPDLEVDVLRTLDADQRDQLLALEPGRLVQLTGMPTTAPFVADQLWIEGWTETYTRQAWRFVLAVTPRGLTGPQPRWFDIPDTYQPEAAPGEPLPARQPLTWLSPEWEGMTWISMAGWWSTEATGSGRWIDLPANLKWGNIPPDVTWSDFG